MGTESINLNQWHSCPKGIGFLREPPR